MKLVVGNLNSGRSKRGVEAVRRTFTEWRDAAERLAMRNRGPNLPIVLFTEEIDEGDRTKPTDHQLLREVFAKRSGWRKIHMARRTPMLLHGIKPRGSKTHPIRAMFRGRPIRGVPHWSPYRTLEETILSGPNGEPDVVLIGGHYPAGSRNGHRPAVAKAMLDVLYDAMLARQRKRIAYHHNAGRHVISGQDTNNRHFPRMHPREKAIATSLPDYIRATPAEGWAVKVRKRDTTRNHFEPFHKGLLAEVEFVREKGKH